jgi:hypothetical protein
MASFVRVAGAAACALLALALAPANTFGQFRWSISDSPIDPAANCGPPGAAGMPVTLYLWAEEWVPGPPAHAIATAEFGLSGSPGYVIQSVAPAPDWFCAACAPGDPTDVVLATGSCPSPPVVAAEIHVLDATGNGGEICFTNSTGGVNVGMECPSGPVWDNHWIGYRADPALVPPSCHHPAPSRARGSCATVSVRDDAWGSVKSGYR